MNFSSRPSAAGSDNSSPTGIRVGIATLACLVLVSSWVVPKASVSVYSYTGTMRAILHVLPGDDGYGNYFLAHFLIGAAYGLVMVAAGLTIMAACERLSTRGVLVAAGFTYAALALFAIVGWLGVHFSFPELGRSNLDTGIFFLTWPTLFLLVASAYLGLSIKTQRRRPPLL